MTYSLEEDRSHVGDRFRPTVYMERVSVKLEAEVESRSKKWVEENVEGKTDFIRTALDVLVDEGYVAREETKREGTTSHPCDRTARPTTSSK